MTFPVTPPKRRRHRALIVVSVAVAVLAIGTAAVTYVATRPTSADSIGSAGATSAAAASPSSSPTPIGSPSAPATSASSTAAADDPSGRAACEQIVKANGTDDLYEPAKMKPIGMQAAKSTNGALKMDGNLLADHADLAKAAKGGENEFSTSLGLGTAALNLITDCYKAGYVKR